MKTALLVFPHQLFLPHPGFNKNPDVVVITEDLLFFGDEQYPCNFHAQKLILHRASMKQYQQALTQQSFKTQYIEYAYGGSKIHQVFENFKTQKIQKVICAEVVDYTLQKRLNDASKQFGITLEWQQTPGFINSQTENQTYRQGKKRWFMADFYQWQRKRLNILVDENQKPTGGQWSFDEENRKKIPQKMVAEIPALNFPAESPFVTEAKSYVSKHFPKAIGSHKKFYYPTNHKAAEHWLQEFFKDRFNNFGAYEDAIVEDENWLYHSILTPMLNIGLLTPQQVVESALTYAKNNDVPLNSLEGFIRQIIGWREFMRATYQDLGVTMRTTNAWQHHTKIPKSFYDGSTGIVPVDNTIKRILETGYCHHIERLMVLGGFMFLCEFDPDEIYLWFMEMFIDSYDWVMVPNVYAMSQNADGGLITTKPYFSGSNYVRKMSHYKTDEWSDIWDALYWRWILKQADSLRKNPRWAMMVRMAEKMDTDKKNNYLKTAEKFLSTL